MNFFSHRTRATRSPDCRGKARRRTREAALAAVARYYAEFGVVLHAYVCDHCGHLHIGHARGSRVAPIVQRAISAAFAVEVPAGPFLARLRWHTLAAAERLCRRPGRHPEELIAAVVDELPAPGLVGRLTASQCEDVLVACEAVEGSMAAARVGRRTRKAVAA